jgi:hypothetical protein
VHGRSSGRDRERLSCHRERGDDTARFYSVIRRRWWVNRSVALVAG